MKIENEIKCPEMTVNGEGEVVYSESQINRNERSKAHTKPTPVMLTNEISKIFVEILFSLI